MTKMNLSESEVKKQIKDCLKAVGALPVSIGASTFGTKAISDFLVCYKGEFIAIEAKHSNWMPPARGTKAYKHYWDQWCFLESVRQAEGKGFFACNIETVIGELGLNIKGNYNER